MMMSPPMGPRGPPNPRNNPMWFNGGPTSAASPIHAGPYACMAPNGVRPMPNGRASPQMPPVQPGMTGSPAWRPTGSQAPSAPLPAGASPTTPQPQPFFYPATPGPKAVRNGHARTTAPPVHHTLGFSPDLHIQRVPSPDWTTMPRQPARLSHLSIRQESMPALLFEMWAPEPLHSEERVEAKPRGRRRRH